MPRINEQVPIEFRAGFGESGGKKGERILLQYVDPRHAHSWRGLEGEGIPAWIGSVYIYQGDELVSVLAPAGGERLPERASQADALALRAECSRMESHRTVLQQQLDLTTTQLRIAQEQLAGVQQALGLERDRYARETASIDESVRRTREEALQARSQILGDLAALRGEATAIRGDVVQGVQDARRVLADVHGHVAEMREVEFAEASHIARRRLRMEQQCSEDLDRYRAISLADSGAKSPSMMENLVASVVQQGLLTPEFILALLQTYKTGVPPGAAPPPG